MDNNNMQKTRIRPSYLCFFKGFGVALLAILLKSIVSFFTWQRYATNSAFGSYENYVIYIVCFVASLFVFNSVFGLAFSFDLYSRDELLEKTHDRKGTLPSFKGIFFYKSFFYEALGITLTLAVAAMLGAFPEIFGMFYTGEGYGPHRSGILPALVVTAISSVFCTWNRFEAARYWKELYRTCNLEEVENKAKLILRIFFITILYPIALPMLPFIAFVVVTAVGLVAAAAVAMTIPVFILTVILIIEGLWWLKVLIGILKRRKFVKELKQKTSELGYELSELKNCYKSLISAKKKCSFKLVGKEKSFDCVMIGNPRYRVPICFTSESEGYFRHRLGTARRNITYQTKFNYAPEGDGRKILIISPNAKDIFVVDEGKERRLFNADKLWDCVAYESDAFIGALERDCLGRYDTFRS